MAVRGGLLTVDGVWDDTDIVHVVTSTISVTNQQSLTGTLRLQSSPTESLVVKLLGTNVGLLAGGTVSDVTDRLGGSLQIIGTPGHAVVLTSLKDDSVGAGLTPQGTPQKDTLNTKGVVAPELPDLPNSGPIIVDAAARDEHGSDFGGIQGWLTLSKELQYVVTNSRVENKPNLVLVVGYETDPSPLDLGSAYSAEAIKWAAGKIGVQLEFAQTGSDIAGAMTHLTDYAAVYVSSDSSYPLPDFRADRYKSIKWFGGAADFMLETLNLNKSFLTNYVNNQGGGLLVMAEDGSAHPYNFLQPAGADPIILKKVGGNVETATTSSEPSFDAIGLTDIYLSEGVPYRFTFQGSTNFNRLQPFAVDPVTGDVAMLGQVAGGKGLGALRDVLSPGDWGSVQLGALSNDTNVDLVNETEQGFTSAGDTNQTPTNAQYIGQLAKDQFSGDDNQRLGFEIHGAVSQTVNNSGGGDVDVYSFQGTAGTMVWFDIDRTAASLDSVVELVDANGAVIARSDNSIAESANPSLLVGSALPLQSGAGGTSDFSQPDFYTTNEKDAGMRVSLPGAAGTVGTYFVRVRSSSTNLNNLTAGVTKGAYVLQVRLQEKDVFPGSTVRYADVRYANNGIEVIGKPEQSALISNTVQTGLGSSSFSSAQDLGNLLESNTGTIDVAGNLKTATDVNWYKFTLNYEQIQSITGLSDGLKTFAAELQVNYADGLGRPDTTLSLYDEAGTLLYVARDGEIADSLPRPNIGGIGTDTANLAHGSYGALDPTLGPIQLSAGAPKKYDSSGNVIPDSVVTYYVAISSNATLPAAMTASFGSPLQNPLIRLEPVDSVNRIVDDRVGSSGGGTTTAGSAGSLFPVTSNDNTTELNTYADSYQLGDVVLFVNTESQTPTGGTTDGLATVNPFTGQKMTNGALDANSGVTGYDNIAMRNDGRLFSLSNGSSPDNTGNYVQFDTSTGNIVSSTDDQLKTFKTTSGTGKNSDPYMFSQVQVGVQYTAMAYWQSDNNTNRRLFAIGERDAAGSLPGTIRVQNLLYELDPDTGQVLHVVTGAEAFTPFEEMIPGTDAIPVGELVNVSQQLVGMTIIGDRMFAITAEGQLYEIKNFLIPPNASTFVSETTSADVTQASATPVGQIPLPAGVTLTGLSAGPPHVEGGAYQNTLFAIDTNGKLYSFDTSGNARGVFLNGAWTVDTGVSNAQGLAFSSLDYNLWHATTSRGNDPGHGIDPSADKNVARNNSTDGTSYYFGLTSSDGQPGAAAYGSNPDILNTYALPGGAYGTLTSTTFDLAGYSAFDKPTLYFNYFLNTPDNNSNISATDAFRVFASTDGAKWELLATNNVVPGSNSENPQVITPSGGSYKGQSANQKVQGLYDNTMVDPTTGQVVTSDGEMVWQQARVDLGDYAGKSNIRLRFEFTTAGTMGSDFSLQGTGDTLKALPGSQLNDGDTFTISGHDFVFRKGVPATLRNEIAINDTDSSTTVAQAIAAALDRVLITDTQQVTLSATSGTFTLDFSGTVANPIATETTGAIAFNASAADVQAALEALPSIAPGDVSVTGGNGGPWKIAFTGQYANQPMNLLAGNATAGSVSAFTVTAADDPAIFSSAKVVGDELRLFGNTITSAGPLPRFTGTLTGDDHGKFDSRTRDRSLSTVEGVYIDDFVVGFASRGEMVSGAKNLLEDPLATDFGSVPAPANDPNQILTGNYQLQIRPAQSFGSVTDSGGLSLSDSFDVNDRFAQAITLVANAASQITDGQTFTIDDGSQALKFEFNLTGGQTVANSILVNISAGDSAYTVATKIRDAINNAVVSKGFKVRAATRDGGDRVDLFDALSVTGLQGVGSGLKNILVFNTVGDTRPVQGVTAPGETIVQDSIVSHSRQIGIQVIPVIGQIEETGVAFTTQGQFQVGIPGNTGSIANVPTNNTTGWVPGIAIKNNLVTHSGRTGIQIGGDPNASWAYEQGLSELGWGSTASFSSAERDTELFLPFVRVINNTVYDALVGIAATNASSPTIMNNIVADIKLVTGNVIRFQGAAIYVDPSSGAAQSLPSGVSSKFGLSVVTANLYQNNSLNFAGSSESLAINLGASDPLFVDAANDNFYLNENSMAIDSSVDSLLDRPALANVVAPLGFAPSPILAPDTDLLGQTRVDDPAVDPPAGVGGNVFKDRGALERADFIGPTAVLLNPVDNDAAGNDRNVLTNQVQLVNTLLTEFTIQLIDGGSGIDDSSVNSSKFVIQRTIGGVTTTLVPNLDYGLAYDTNSKIVHLVPAQGLWINGTYTINLDRTANGIKDLAGNVLQENTPPETKFVIDLTDTIVSGWQNPTNKYDVNNNGAVNGQDLIILINRILMNQGGPLPLVATPPPYLDVNGDGALRTSDILGVVNEILREQAQASAAVAEPQIATNDTTTTPSAPQDAPIVTPLVESNSVAAGLTMSQASSQPEAEPTETYAPVSTPAPAPVAAPQAVAAAIVDDTPVADETEGLNAWDADLDSILTDLSGDLRKRTLV